MHPAPNVKCAAIGARTIEVLGTPVNGLHKDKMGEFRMIAATEVNGKVRRGPTWQAHVAAPRRSATYRLFSCAR